MLMWKLVVTAAVLFAPLTNTWAIPVSFLHGVASGDPLSTSIIIWTRVTPRIAPETITALYGDLYYDGMFASKGSLDDVRYNVTWMVSENEDLSNPVQAGVYSAGADRDFTVKVDVTGLAPRTQYFYRFMVGGDDSSVFTESPAFSPIGRFRLPPPEGEPLEALRYAIFASSNWGWGYFNAYDYASQLDLDFFLHVGDYIYEYGPGEYPTPSEAVRFAPFPYGLQPPHEMVLLEDYRARHAHYRTDPGLQALTASAAMIANWDDHEITDDTWASGAENHNVENEEGDYSIRRFWAVRAYHEWMPTRSGQFGTESYIDLQLWRKFPMGDLATVYSLEQRLTAKTEQFPGGGSGSIAEQVWDTVTRLPPERWNGSVRARLRDIRREADAVRNDPSRTIIGPAQMDFIRTGLAAQQTRWALVGQTSNVNDLIADYQGAIAARNASDPETAAFWAELLSNLTGDAAATYTSYSTSPHYATKMGSTFPVTDDMRASARYDRASGEFGIVTWFDPWHAYTANREDFLQTLAAAGGNAVVYGGDTHGSYAAYLRTGNDTQVGVEFNAPAVTSPSWEQFRPQYPMDLVAAATIAGDPAQNHFMADFRHKGFIWVQLNHQRHHADFVWVTHGSPDYAVKCDRAFDVPATTNPAPATENGSQLGSAVVRANCSLLPEPVRYSQGVETLKNGIPANYVEMVIGV